MLSTCIVFSLLIGEVNVPVKSVAASAEDIHSSWLIEPDPNNHGARSHYSIHRTLFENNIAEFEIQVPDGDCFKLLPFGENSDDWSIQAISPSGKVIVGNCPNSKLVIGNASPNSEYQATRLDINNPEAGKWRLILTGGHHGDDAMLLVEDGFDLHLRVWLDDYANYKGNVVKFTSGYSLYEDVNKNGEVATAKANMLGYSIVSQNAQIKNEDGDVIHSLQRGNDFEFQPSESGIYFASIEALLKDGNGCFIQRTAILPIAVEDRNIELSNQVDITSIDAFRSQITLHFTTPVTRDRLMSGAEVWGTSKDGHKARCWIGGVTPVKNNSATLLLDTRWLHNCDPNSIEIRSLRLADINTFIPLARVNQIPLHDIHITDIAPSPNDMLEMQMGTVTNRNVTAREYPNLIPDRSSQYGGHNLMLVHGYCEDGDAWPTGHFDGDFAEYENLYQNFSHDQFALDIWSYGSQFKSYSIIGHSQGGNAGLHLFAFYWSGIDWSTGSRKIQALGVPFGGTPLAGSIADLAEVFGIQCGSNYDMTYDGSALWASYIPGWARAETWSWSTTFEDGWFYDYCNIVSDLLLWDPEDGVVEVSAAHLGGANNMGTKEGWCHVEDMSDPPQTSDYNRNAEMNQEAAR